MPIRTRPHQETKASAQQIQRTACFLERMCQEEHNYKHMEVGVMLAGSSETVSNFVRGAPGGVPHSHLFLFAPAPTSSGTGNDDSVMVHGSRTLCLHNHPESHSPGSGGASPPSKDGMALRRDPFKDLRCLAASAELRRWRLILITPQWILIGRKVLNT